MQKKMLLCCGAAGVFGSFGLFARWLQVMSVFEEDTGLARRGAPQSLAVLVICVVAVFALALAVRYLKDYRIGARPQEAMAHSSKIYPLLMLLAGLLMAAGSLLRLVNADTPTRILAIWGVASAFAYAYFPVAPRREGTGSALSILVVLFFCFWLVVFYRENSGDPVMWNYVLEMLALVVVTLAFYYMAGFLFYRAKLLRTIYSALLAVFLCMTALGGELGLAWSLILAGSALTLLTLAGVIILNLKDGGTAAEENPPAAPSEEE